MGSLDASALPEAARLLASEGWTFTPRELARILATAQGLSVAHREDGALQGLVMVARHGPLAWIGNVVVARERRGKGLGEALVREALRRIDAAGCATTKLCSVHAAVTLYERLGFAREGEVATFTKVHERPTHRPREADPLLVEDVPEVAAFDARAFGAPRDALLAQLARDYPDTAAVVRRAGRIAGYAYLKVGDEGSEVGPLVVQPAEPGVAALLLDAVLAFRLQGGAAGLECTVPAAHPWMRALLEERGFAPKDTKVLMARGAPLRQDGAACAALGGLEKG